MIEIRKLYWKVARDAALVVLFLGLAVVLGIQACVKTTGGLSSDKDDVAMLSDGHTQLLQQLKTNNENVRRLLCRLRVTPSDGPCDTDSSP